MVSADGDLRQLLCLAALSQDTAAVVPSSNSDDRLLGWAFKRWFKLAQACSSRLLTSIWTIFGWPE